LRKIREARRLSGVLKRSKSRKTELRIEHLAEQISDLLEAMTADERDCLNGVEWFADGDRWIISEAFLVDTSIPIEIIDEQPYQSSYDATYEADYDQTEDIGRETTAEEKSTLEEKYAKLRAEAFPSYRRK
jgi:hypothetical protein